MGDPDIKAKRSATRKRNIIAKQMWEETGRVKKVHMSAKDREKQRKWRLKNDPEGDYENLDEWLVR
jgi:septation ring formation regulator EzrA